MTSFIQIIGAGQMGQGIAQICLTSGMRVHLVDIHENQRIKSIEKITKHLDRHDINHLSHGDSLLLEQTDFIIEAIAENLPLKEQLWRNIPSFFREDDRTVFASNTSSFSITELASFSPKPSSFIGIHFMNPVPKMDLVEIIHGLLTSDETCQKSLDFVQRLKKTSIIAKDRPGFIVNRILIPMINEAIFLLDQGIGDATSIDTAMTLGAHHPMGPLALADFIGLDTCLAILKDLHARLGEDKYRPCPLLEVYVKAGYLGKKSKQGFYTY